MNNLYRMILRKVFGHSFFQTGPPTKTEEIPGFLREELALFRGFCKKRFLNVKATFKVNNPREYDRIQNLKAETDLLKMIIDETEEDDIFWDIGSNIGTHSVLTYLSSKCKVIGFEPFTPNYESCSKNFQLNNVDGEVFEAGLMDSTRKTGITEETGKTGEGRNHISNESEIEVQVYEADSLLEQNGLKNPDIIKIDVEGAELRTLEGMKNILESKKDLKIFIELHPERISRYGDSKDELLNFLKNRNFKTHKIGMRNREEYLKAVKHI